MNEPLQPATSTSSEPLDVLVAYVPTSHTESVLAALFEAGAGALGNYRECAFVAPGTGQFRPLPGATPAVGDVGALERVAEDRIEVTVRRSRRSGAVAALRRAHPYEEPAFHLIETAELPL